ncbi:NAD(P)/FAD-dependent oxidoreductase [Roseofilum casamattae]|uniref:FAD/NAD(P)-binding oxidoreductase n=1 Tax=Roseofilum casamattae BLCC-M143 TaxID=3022442 RepID=A0ABT7BT90_9CYAN|nr:FAD/NAD(P)-binding oxidoreductase [Roseofilum casamattae]MDJ1181716.1 FAD/NAD(P)-binding oxidoreductase [Roseofilum casamattae BLCC-M143]
MTNSTHHQILIIGGGSAGLTVASQLLAANKSLDVAIIEPSEKHYYQPAWTLVGGGVFAAEDTMKPEQECVPSGASWIKAYCQEFNPDNNQVTTRDGAVITYDYLVVCPGIQLDWHLVEGLPETLGKNGVCSNYLYEQAPKTWEIIRNFQGGTAIFTYPNTPIKCAGAPQKIMYLADETFRKNGVRDRSKILYCTAGGGIFGVPAYAKPLMEIVDRKTIDLKVKHNLKAINGERKEATFDVTTDAGVESVTIPYDMIHVTPPMSAPDFIKQSPLAGTEGPAKGWVEVDKFTLQHKRYPNVFSLGDASSLPTSKTAAAVRSEAPVVASNLLLLMDGKSLTANYDGYACCPLVTGYGKVIFAEFDYEKKPTPTFPLDPTQERYSMWLLKRYGLPFLYWNRMIKGKQFERSFLAKKP